MLYGRDAERATIGGLLDAARDARSSALVVRGEAGAGKTALLEDTRERAADMHVLVATGVESESELPFAGLHQLVRPALHLVERLPEPQANALRGALGLSDRGQNERFLVSAGCLSLLSELAERRPVLCLVDDAQWLDTPTADALLFVARRLDAEGIVMMFGAREGDERRFEGRGLAEIELGSLDETAAEHLILRGRDGTLSPAVRDALIAQSGGLALALVELPAALTPAQLAGVEPLPDTLPLTRDVERLFSERVRRLPRPTQRALLIVAASEAGTVAPVNRAAEALGLGADALTPAEEAGLVAVHGPRIDVRHPLVRSAVLQSASSHERRRIHLALADALDGELEADQRAWHRAAAALGPDEEIAAELEQTAERARTRSGHAAAAAALQRAAELSADGASRARRLVAAARAAWEGGQPDRATILLDRARPDVADPQLRAEAAHVRGEIEWRCGVLANAAATLLEGADDAAATDPGKAVEMLFDACFVGFDRGDVPQVADAARRASELPTSDTEGGALRAELIIGVGRVALGDSAAVPDVRAALERIADLDDPRSLVMAAVGATGVGDEATRAAVLRRADALARTAGAVDVLSTVLVNVAVTGLITNQFTAAASAEEGLELAREAGLSNAATIHLAVLAWLDALHGREAECLARAAAVADSARVTGLALANTIAEWAIAMLDLSAGRIEETTTRLLALRAAPPGIGHRYFIRGATPDLVEACVRTGRGAEAQAAYGTLEDFAGPDAPLWAQALAARCRALLARDDEETEAAFAETLALYERTSRPYERARTELLYGEQLRRKRRRVEARDHLRTALEAFEGLGAVAWAERARAELRASGETARKRDPSTVSELTPQELQVARFVAEGLSNKEVAAQLFLSPRTIDAHLRNVFAKLGITSRTQLARLQLGFDDVTDAAPTSAVA